MTEETEHALTPTWRADTERTVDRSRGIIVWIHQ